MEEPNRKKWAEDDDDDWEEPTEAKPAPSSKPEERPDYHADRHSRLESLTPPYYFDIRNLAYAIDSEDKLRPHIIGTFTAEDLRIRPFEECPRGEAQVQTDNLDLAKHLMDLDEEAIEGRPIHVRIHKFQQQRGGARRGRRGERGSRRGDRGDRGERGGRHQANPAPPVQEPVEAKVPKERPKFVNTKKATPEAKAAEEP